MKPKRPEDLTIADVERAIDLPTSDWHGNCYMVACAILRAGLVAGRPAYGHYLGPVASTGYWAERKGRMFQRHGWIVTGGFEETILDPTRWSFEDKKPYLHLHNCGDHDYVCADCGLVPEEHGVVEDSCLDFRKQRCEYDEGGNRLREAMRGPLPASATRGKPMKFTLPDARVRSYVMALLENPKFVTDDHLFWLANLPLREFGPYAPEIFRAFVDAGHGGMLPIDNRRLVLGEGEV